ncbi:deoxyribose-phosphate aldolase [Sphingomonas zeicaulis]|uniref:deoxyribose-phosphate aldolase n=1 Tax=Sphingomonas zeicaulis TaxID=1632740 RepID=UPI003D1CD625
MTASVSPFDAAWIERTVLSPVIVARRIAAITPETGEGAVADLRLALAATDLTTLQGDDTEDRVRALAERASALGTAAVCVYPAMVPAALTVLADSGVAVATVAAGFPHGLSPLSTRIAEVAACVELGATEIDVVIRRSHALTGNWQALYDEVAAFRAACGSAHLKTILGTGELADPTIIARAALVCIMAGADFVKTSTGKEAVNATLEAGVAMMAAIEDWHGATGALVGFKAAGGIATADDALRWIALARNEMGEAWLAPTLFRFGASRLVDDIVRRLPGG